MNRVEVRILFQLDRLAIQILHHIRREVCVARASIAQTPAPLKGESIMTASQGSLGDPNSAMQVDSDA